MAENSMQQKNIERQQQPLVSQNIPPLIAFPNTKSPSESNHSTNRQQPQKNVNNLLSHPSSQGMPSPARSGPIKSDRANQAGSNGNANNLDGSEIRLIEIEGLWIVSSPNIVPYAQLQFMCDLNELNYDTVLEKYWKSTYKTRDLHTQEYINNFYNDKLQQKQAGDRLKALFKQSGSTIPGVLSCFLHNSEKQTTGELQLNLIDALQAKEEDYLPQILHNFSQIQQGNITQAFYSSLNNFMLFGFHTNNSLPPPIPRLNGFQLLLALFDCFGQTYAQQLNQLLKKDLYFSGEHLFKLVSFYTERKQQPSTSRLNYNTNNHDNSSMIQSLNTGEESEKVDLLKVLEGMLERIKKMKNNGIRNSVYLYYSFQSFFTKIHNKSTLLDGDNDDENDSNAKMQLGEMQSFYQNQSKEHSSAEKEKLLENTPYAIHFYEEWMHVKTTILRQEPLTKKMEAIWVHAAFKELYYDAVQMLGEKSIIAEENAQIGLKCFVLLSDLGEKNSIHLHYSLLCYHGLYKEAAQLLGESKRNDLQSMQIQCQIRNSEIKQSLDKLRVLCLNRIEAYDFYLLTKCVFTQEERDFFGALCVLVVITSKSTNNFPLFENLLIAKMLMRGTSFLPKNIVQSYVLLKALLKRGKFELMKDYICRLFIKKNLHKVLEVITPEQLKLAKGIVKQLCRKSNESSNKANKKKKGGANPLLNPSRVVQNHSQPDEGVVCFSEQFYAQLFQFSVKDMKRSILSKIEMLKSKSELQYVSSQLREYYNELITIGRNVLFMPEKGYSSGNLASNFDYFNAKNKQNIDIQQLSLQQTDVQSLKQLIASQHVSIIFNLPNIQYKILKYFYAKKTAAIKDFISSSQNSSVHLQQSSLEGSFELIQQEQLLHNPYYLKVQKQLEQIEERTEYSLPMSFASQNNLSLQPSQEGGDFKQAREQQSHQQSQQSQTQGYLVQNSNNINQPGSNNILIQEQNNNGGEIDKQQKKPEEKEKPSDSKEQKQPEEGTLQGQNHNEQQQHNHKDNNNNYSLGSDAIINANTEESSSSVSKYFSMQLDSDYAISIEGKLSQDEVLIFSEDDIISLQGDQQQSQSNQRAQHEKIAMKFNPQSEYLLVRINSRDITRVLNGELAKVISPFCLRHYGFLTRGEGQWYVLQQPFENVIGFGFELSFAQIHQLANIVNALQLVDLTGIFAYYGTDLLFQRENNLYLSNIISVSQLVLVEYIGFEKESNSNQQSGQFEREYAPELFSGSMNIDRAKSDVWMIGVILFQSIFQKPLVCISPQSQQQSTSNNVGSQRIIQKEQNSGLQKQDKQQGNAAETKQDLYLKEVFKFKEQNHLKMILQAEKAAYYQNNSQNQKGDKDATETTPIEGSKEENKKCPVAIIPQDIMEVKAVIQVFNK